MRLRKHLLALCDYVRLVIMYSAAVVGIVLCIPGLMVLAIAEGMDR